MFSALKPLFLSLSILPSSRLLPPLSVSVSLLSFCPFSFPLLCPPSLLLPAALPTRSHSPRSHTQAASSPLHFYLHTHLFTPPSQLLSPPSFFRHLLTHIIPRISPVCCLSRSPPSLPIPPSFSLTHSLTQPCGLAKRTRTHTHADWHPRTKHPLPKTGFQAVRSRGQHASWHWAQLRKRTRKRPWSTATSLFFPQTGAPGAQGRIPLRLPRDALSDHYPSSTIVSCSVLAYQVRDVHISVFFHLHALFCVNLLAFFDDSLALVACSVASWFVVHLPAGLSECVVHSCSRVSFHAHILLIHQPDLVANTCACTCTKHVCVCACVHLEFLMLLPLTWKDSGIIGRDILISEITLFQYFPDIWSQTKRWHLFY